MGMEFEHLLLKIAMMEILFQMTVVQIYSILIYDMNARLMESYVTLYAVTEE